MKGKLSRKYEQHLRYNSNKWIKKGNFYMINDIIENFTLVKLMDLLVNINRSISIVGCWIFDSKYEKSLHLTR